MMQWRQEDSNKMLRGCQMKETEQATMVAWAAKHGQTNIFMHNNLEVCLTRHTIDQLFTPLLGKQPFLFHSSKLSF